jgi:glycosyltransferase involved in cell wall biosynthesis
MLDLSWRLALRHTDYLTAISNYLIDRAKRLGYRGYGFVIPNGVDIKKFENQNEHVKGVIRVKTLKLKPEDICLITTSRLTEKNAVDDIIESLQFLEDKFVLLILGTGNLEKTLKQKVSALKLEDRVKFLGLQSPSGVITYLHDSDIFVRPSRSEGLGNSFIEAMAAGIPVIATRVGGIPDFLIDRETGLFCEVNNPKSIAEKVMEYYRDPGLKSKIVRQAREMVEKRYDWDLIAKRMKVEIFDTVELCEY